MEGESREPIYDGLSDFDTFFLLLEDKHGFDAIKLVSNEIHLANSGALEVVDLRKRADGRFNMYCTFDMRIRIVVVLSKGKNGMFAAEEGGFLGS